MYGDELNLNLTEFAPPLYFFFLSDFLALPFRRNSQNFGILEWRGPYCGQQKKFLTHLDNFLLSNHQKIYIFFGVGVGGDTVYGKFEDSRLDMKLLKVSMST